MSKNVAMISTINKRKVMLHKDFAKTFSLSNKKSYPIKIANQSMNSSQKQIKKINSESAWQELVYMVREKQGMD